MRERHVSPDVGRALEGTPVHGHLVDDLEAPASQLGAVLADLYGRAPTFVDDFDANTISVLLKAHSDLSAPVKESVVDQLRDDQLEVLECAYGELSVEVLLDPASSRGPAFPLVGEPHLKCVLVQKSPVTKSTRWAGPLG
jgi:hypothetical protein